MTTPKLPAAWLSAIGHRLSAIGHRLFPKPPPPPPPPKRILALALEFFLEQRGSGVGQPHIRNLESKVGRFARAFDISPGELTVPLIGQYLSSPENGFKLRTRKNHRAAIVQFTNWLRANGYLPKDWSMDAVKVPRPRPTKICVVEPALMQLFMFELPGHLRAAFALVAFGNLRTQEVMPSKEILASKEVLQWSDISFDAWTIDVRKEVAKMPGRDRTIPMPANLREWLLQVPPEERVGPVCPIRSALNVMAKTKRTVGIPADRGDTHNFMRDSCISATYAILDSEALCAKRAGTSEENINRSYRKKIPEAQARAWFEIRPKARIAVVEAKPNTILITLGRAPAHLSNGQ